MREEEPFEIHFAREEEWEEAMGLAWKTFLEFEAADYAPEGVRSFEDFVTDSRLRRMFLAGDYRMLVARRRGKLVGMITLRNRTHISLLFVEKSCHRKGIGRALIARMADYVRGTSGCRRLTVNASPYGTAFYHRLGFRDLESERRQNGIIFTPMEYIW